MNIGHLNVCSIFNKCEEVKNLIFEEQLDIFCATETNLNNDMTLNTLKNYNIIRTDRDLEKVGKKSGGGVAIFSQKHLSVDEFNFKCKTEIDYISFIEYTGIKVKIDNHKTLAIVCIYRPPEYLKSTLQNDINSINIIFKELESTKMNFICVGDYNLKSTWSMNLLNNKIQKLNLKQLIKENTRGNSLLDLIITNCSQKCNNSILCK